MNACGHQNKATYSVYIELKNMKSYSPIVLSKYDANRN